MVFDQPFDNFSTIPKECKGRMMKNVCIHISIVVFLLAGFVGLAWAQRLEVVTEQYPPYNYEEDGKVKGVGTEVVEEVLREAKIEYNIKVLPWARALRMAEEKENVLIYCISRTEKREELYTWAGVIAPINFYIFALKSRNDIPEMKSLDQARPYRIGTVNKDAMDQFFIDNKFPKTDRTTLNEFNVKKLFHGRIDLWPMSEYTANYLTKKNGYDPKDLKKVYEIKGFSGGDQFMAISNTTDAKILQKIQDALKKIKDDGRYQEILSKYQ
jgi:polar amino acid transport system substrate-binding protein